MQIGGLIKLSLVDYPGMTAAVIFTQGCNFRCPYCHNKELVIPSCFAAPIAQEEIISFLVKRKGLLGGVVITGGEPTIQKDLLNFMQTVKALAYKIKLDTNGSRPDVLQDIINQKLVDYIAMDVKAPLGIYSILAGVSVDTDSIAKSIGMIKSSGIAHQLRTTLVRPLLKSEDIPQLFNLVCGAKTYVLQNFTPRESLLDPALAKDGTFSENEFVSLQKKWEISEKV